jgi:hypothetical protein
VKRRDQSFEQSAGWKPKQEMSRLGSFRGDVGRNTRKAKKDEKVLYILNGSMTLIAIHRASLSKY